MDSIRIPPKIHRFYGEVNGFWVDYDEVYPCKSVIASTLILGLLYLAKKYIESLKSVIHNEKKSLF
jgi:hypothetical protein